MILGRQCSVGMIILAANPTAPTKVPVGSGTLLVRARLRRRVSHARRLGAAIYRELCQGEPDDCDG